MQTLSEVEQRTQAPSSAVELYLYRVRLALGDVPPEERSRLIEQARAEIDLELELRHLGPDEAASVLAEKGRPEDLAQRLRGEVPLPSENATANGSSRLAPCRACRHEVAREAMACPHCGAPFPARQEWRGRGYEYKSKRELFGWPLVHVAFGRDSNGKLRVAKGIIAVGQFAVGGITVAQFGIGFLFALGQFVAAPIAVGQFALGLVAVGQFGLGILFGAGLIATGLVAKGLLAIGNFFGK